MAAELVDAATSERMTDMDWEKNIKICELVAHDQRQAKDVIKQIKKRLGSKNTSRQLFAVMLLEMLMNNIGEHIHKQVIEAGILPLLVKIVKKRCDLPVRKRIFFLLDATQTSLGGASGIFPQYYSAYSDLLNAGVQLSQVPETITSNQSSAKGNDDNSNGVSIKSDNLTNTELASSMHQSEPLEETNQTVPESSVIQKACNALEVLKDVIDAADTQKNYEGAKDEFTLDLVEQCSFQKQRVMQLVLSSRDENIVSQAIEVNEDLQNVLARHHALISVSPASNSNNSNHEETEEEEVEQLFRRKQKGKACVVPENEIRSTNLGPMERSHRQPIRPLSIDANATLAIPPPPSKHAERERFFQDKKVDLTKEF